MHNAEAKPITRRVLIGIGVALLVVLVAGNLLARRLLLFSPDDLVFAADDAFVLTDDVVGGLAVFAQSAMVEADVGGHALIAANNVRVDGDIGAALTVLASDVLVNGDVMGDLLVLAERVEVTGEVRGEAVLFASDVDIRGTVGGAVTICSDKDVPQITSEVRDCDAAAARSLMTRAGRQLAGVGLASAIANPGVFALARPVLPLPLALLFTGVGALFVVVFPVAFNRMTVAARAYPRRMAATGGMVSLLMLGLLAGLLVVLAYLPVVGLALLPLYMVVSVVFGLLLMSGWATVAYLAGGWIIRRVSSAMLPPVLLEVVGGVVLAALSLALYALPLGGIFNGVVFFLLGLGGLGASYSTRFGRRGVVV